MSDRTVHATMVPKPGSLRGSRPAGVVYDEIEEPVLSTIAAEFIAKALHANQKDKAGEPYWKHVVAVGDMVALLGGTPDEIIAGYFHDAVEDGKATLVGLMEFGATETTLNIVEALTKHPGESNEESLQRVLRGGLCACRVKFADLLNNTRHDRVRALLDLAPMAEDPIEFERKIYRRLATYQHWIRVLMVELGLLGPEVGVS